MIAEAGASAALTGLVFVAVSINLEKVFALSSLPGRARESITQLFSVLIIATLCLIPNQSMPALGWQLLLLGLCQWTMTAFLQLRYVTQHRGEPWHWMGTRVLLRHRVKIS